MIVLPLCCLFILLHEAVNDTKLPRPPYIVQELAQVKAIVIRGVRLRMVCRCDGAHLMSVDCVKVKEPLYFFGDYTWLEMAPGLAKFPKPDHFIT